MLYGIPQNVCLLSPALHILYLKFKKHCTEIERQAAKCNNYKFELAYVELFNFQKVHHFLYSMYTTFV